MNQKIKLHHSILGIGVLLLLVVASELVAQNLVPPQIGPDTTRVNADSTLPILAPSAHPTITTNDSAWRSPWRITRSTIQQQFAEDLGDLLYYLPGLWLMDLGSSGQPMMLGRHGATPRQTMIYWEGRPLYDPLTGAMDLNFIPPQFLHAINAGQEFTTASDWGPESIAMVTAQATETVPHSLVSYHKAPLGFSDVDISFGQPLSRKMTLLLGGIIKSYDGKTQAHHFEQQNFRGRLLFHYSPRWQIEYLWLHNKLNRGQPGPLLASGDYRSAKATQKNGRLDQTLIIHGRLGQAPQPNLKAVIYHSSIVTKFSDLDRALALKNSGSYAGIRCQWRQNWMGQNLTFASGFHHEWTDTDEWGNQRLSSASLEVGDTWEWHGKLGLQIMSGIQFQDRGGPAANGRMDLFWRASNGWRWTASLNQTVLYPTLYELYASTDYFGNTDLKNEIHRKLTWGLEWQPAPSIGLNAAVYLRKILHPIDLSPAYTVQPVFYNAPHATSAGFDFQSDWTITTGWESHALLTLMERNTPSEGSWLRVIYYLQYADRFFQNDLQPILRLETRYFRYRQGWFSMPWDLSAAGKPYQSALILNGQLVLAIGNLKIFFLLENIFDQKYALMEGYPMNGRTIHYGVRWEFWD